jgi:hypothetical protein
MLRAVAIAFAALTLVPLASHAIWWQLQDHPNSWSEANWSSARLLPTAETRPDAVVHVLAGRTGRWKGIFAHHTWIVVKPRGGQYARYEVVGWGPPVRRNGWAPDGRWYGDTPRILLTLRGGDAERAIPAILAAIESYPYASLGSYVVWPGPNSNTFIAYVARHVPELAQALLPTAVGKDFAGWPVYVGSTPSHTGVQISLGGVIGVSIGWVEGFEINVFGLITGLDVRRPALKLPGWGRIGIPAAS